MTFRKLNVLLRLQRQFIKGLSLFQIHMLLVHLSNKIVFSLKKKNLHATPQQLFIVVCKSIDHCFPPLFLEAIRLLCLKSVPLSFVCVAVRKVFGHDYFVVFASLTNPIVAWSCVSFHHFKLSCQ